MGLSRVDRLGEAGLAMGKWDHSTPTSTHRHTPDLSTSGNNEGWGFEFDMEAMARDAGTRHDRYQDERSRGVNYSDSWFSPRGRKDSDEYDAHDVSQADADQEDSEYQEHDWSTATQGGTDNRYTHHQWFTGNNDEGDSYDEKQKEEEDQRPHANDVEELEDVWDVRGTVQWEVDPAQDDDEEEEVVLDELTRYWATPNVYDVFRPKPKRTQLTFSERMQTYDGDNWGRAPDPVMTYDGGYTSDVLIEQSKREFWVKRNGEWFLLNKSTDTRISHQGQQSPQTQQIHQSHQSHQGNQGHQNHQGHQSSLGHQRHQQRNLNQRDEGSPIEDDSSRSDGENSGSHSDGGVDEEFSLQPYDFEKEGFVGEEDWKRPRRDPVNGNKVKASMPANIRCVDDEKTILPTNTELIDLEETSTPTNTIPGSEPEMSTLTYNKGAIGLLLDLDFDDTMTGTMALPDSVMNAAAENLSTAPPAHIDSTIEALGGLSLHQKVPNASQPKVLPSQDLLIDLDTKELSSPVQPLIDLDSMPSQPAVSLTSPMKLDSLALPAAQEPRAISSDSLIEFASPHEWLNQIAKKNMEQFQESMVAHKKEWVALMEKQEQDSRKLDEFIRHHSDAKKARKPRGRIPVSLSMLIETRDFGQQEIRVTENDDLKVLVEDFCAKYQMQSFEMAIWVTVADALKKQKKMLRKQSNQQTGALI
ncbi:hypothetical protein BGZ54_005352 [Gamsiella multidivaricata]|nr:hypothetical protein BGZ54_005352 [Gamsiella multidivaricata]